MNNEMDIKFNIISECANRILSFQANLKEVDLKEEKEQLELQKQLIKEYTDAPIDYILRYVTKINDAKKTRETEQNPEKRKMLENAINVYTGFIKSKINDEPLIEENREDKSLISENAQNKSITTGDEIASDKCAQYRASQKYDLELLKLAKEVSQMCEDHQIELKTKKQRRKEPSRKRN